MKDGICDAAFRDIDRGEDRRGLAIIDQTRKEADMLKNQDADLDIKTFSTDIGLKWYRSVCLFYNFFFSNVIDS